ncbi:phage major capsid protein [Anatilimnocola floriformis]|uniref:phage major capsid protein n=1 Tax=Anatilimnocola floriformis TaxID=2948575 RepID=UPI0020C234A0|nr:phage major capsid protein [Anatilimnocola floriformis]
MQDCINDSFASFALVACYDGGNSPKPLREKRAHLAKQAEAILNKATDEARALTAEEQTQFDKIHADVDALKATIDAIERQDATSADLEDVEREAPPGEPTGEQRSQALKTWLMSGVQSATAEQRNIASRCGVDVNRSELNLRFARTAPRTREEARALSTTTTAGGYTVPQGFQRTLEEALLAYGAMREVATVMRTDGFGDLPMPTVNDTAQKGALLAENTAASEQDIAFGQLILQAYKYSSKMIRVSVELLQDSAFNLEEYLGRALGERIGRITNDHFTTADGSSKPNGIVTAATLGKTGANGQTTSVTYADLVDLQHSVDPAYRSNAVFMFNDSTLKAIKKLVDSQNRPLWSAGMASGDPDTILGCRYVINQSMPTMATSAKSILYGDCSKYIIRDASDIQLVRLNERYGEYHQVGFLAFARCDGDLLDAGTNPVKYYANSAS